MCPGKHAWRVYKGSASWPPDPEGWLCPRDDSEEAWRRSSHQVLEKAEIRPLTRAFRLGKGKKANICTALKEAFSMCMHPGLFGRERLSNVREMIFRTFVSDGQRSTISINRRLEEVDSHPHGWLTRIQGFRGGRNYRCGGNSKRAGVGGGACRCP